jgi:hypothetical protein
MNFLIEKWVYGEKVAVKKKKCEENFAANLTFLTLGDKI